MGYVWVEREGRDVVTHAAPKEDGVGQSHNLTQTHIEKKKKLSSGLHFTEWDMFFNRL